MTTKTDARSLTVATNCRQSSTTFQTHRICASFPLAEPSSRLTSSLPTRLPSRFLQATLSLVPVWEVEDGRVRQCGWDGRKLRLLDSLDLQADICHPLPGIPGWARTRARLFRRSVELALSPRDVVPAYWPYVRWKCLQRTLSAVLQVHATQVRSATLIGQSETPTWRGWGWAGSPCFRRWAWGRGAACQLRQV